MSWVLGASAIASIVLGLGGDAWELMARSWYSSDFGVTDPLFGLDISAYVFTIPVLRLAQSWLFFGLMIGAAGATCVYALALYAVDPTFERVRFYLDTRARLMRTHLLSATAGLVALAGMSMWLGTYDVLISRNDRMVGATYSDIYARLPATQALALTLWLGTVLLIATIFRRNFSLLVPGAALFVAVLVLGRGILPVPCRNFRWSRPRLLRKSLTLRTTSHLRGGRMGSTASLNRYIRPKRRSDPKTSVMLPRPWRISACGTIDP